MSSISTDIKSPYDKLVSYRKRTDLKLKPLKHLKSTFTDFNGQEKPLVVRYYQIQGIIHLVAMKRFLLGDDTGLGKTLEAIGALCYIWEATPETKAIVLTTKSASKQWVREFSKFTVGVKVILCQGSPGQRASARKLFEQATGPTVLVMGYRSAVQDFRLIQEWKDYLLITDEATTYKTPTTQVHQVCRHLAGKADRVWALTATLIKNHLMEGFGIMQGVVIPGLFQTGGHAMSKNQFMLYFCITRMQSIPGSNRQIPVIVGYTPEKIQEFRDLIDPYFLGRPKHAVATELPAVVMQELEVDMTPLQEEKYAEAMHGLLQVGDGEKTQEKEVSKLTALIYHQEIANSPELIDVLGDSPKLDALVELLKEGDFADEKVIVYTRFKRFVDIIMTRFKSEKIKALRITGDENGEQRDRAMQVFQNPDSDVRAICLTAAGTESINLQAAKVLVCMDTPWSAGDFLQLLGRMIRIGSVHDRCFVIHMLARNRGGGPSATIDHKVMKTLHKKMDLIEAVLGKRLKGVGDAAIISSDNEISDLFSELRADAQAHYGVAPKKSQQPVKVKPPSEVVMFEDDISDVLKDLGIEG